MALISVNQLINSRSDRLAVLDAVKDAKLKTLRLFISYTPQNNKATGSVNMPDIEPNQVGTYDDTQLRAIDQLMVEARERGTMDSIDKCGHAEHRRYQAHHRHARPLPTGLLGKWYVTCTRRRTITDPLRHLRVEVQASGHRLRENTCGTERCDVLLPRRIPNLRL